MALPELLDMFWLKVDSYTGVDVKLACDLLFLGTGLYQFCGVSVEVEGQVDNMLILISLNIDLPLPHPSLADQGQSLRQYGGYLLLTGQFPFRG